MGDRTCGPQMQTPRPFVHRRTAAVVAELVPRRRLNRWRSRGMANARSAGVPTEQRGALCPTGRDDIGRIVDKSRLMSTSDPADPTASLTVRFEENGHVQVEELAKAVLSVSPAWATIAFLARERDGNTGGFGPPRVSLRRYKRRGGRFVVDKHFTLTNAAQARGLMQALGAWFGPDGPGMEHGAAVKAGDDDM